MPPKSTEDPLLTGTYAGQPDETGEDIRAELDAFENRLAGKSAPVRPVPLANRRTVPPKSTSPLLRQGKSPKPPATSEEELSRRQDISDVANLPDVISEDD